MGCSDEHNGDIALLPTWCMRRGAVVDSLEGMFVVEDVGVFDINWVLTTDTGYYYLCTIQNHNIIKRTKNGSSLGGMRLVSTHT